MAEDTLAPTEKENADETAPVAELKNNKVSPGTSHLSHWHKCLTKAPVDWPNTSLKT